jgi:hypothetical protein
MFSAGQVAGLHSKRTSESPNDSWESSGPVVVVGVSEDGKAVAIGFHTRANRMASAIWERVMFLAIRSRSLWAAGSDPAAARLSHMCA